MTKGIVSGHPRVTIERRPHGSVVVYDKRWTDAGRRRALGFLGGVWVIGLAYLGYVLWDARQTGDIGDVNPLKLIVPAGVMLITTVVVWIYGKSHVEILLAIEQLEVRPYPIPFGGTNLDRSLVGRIQVERVAGGWTDMHMVRFVSRDGAKLYPSSSGSFAPLNHIPTQDEATALAKSIAQQFGVPYMTMQQVIEQQRAERDESGRSVRLVSEPLLAAQPEDLTTNAAICVRQSDRGTVVVFQAPLSARLGELVMFLLMLIFLLWMFRLLAGSGLFGSGEPFVAQLCFAGGLGVMFLITVLSLVSVFVNRVEFTIEDGKLRRKTVPLPDLYDWADPVVDLPLANIERVGGETLWDSYDRIHHVLLAHVFEGDDIKLGQMSESSAIALCQILHRHLGVPI